MSRYSFRAASKRHAQKGLSLVELMISITLGLMLTLAIVQVLYTSQTTYRLDRETAAIQENARFAVDLIRREMVNAGYNGCGPDAQNALQLLPGTPENWYRNGPGILGFDHGEADADWPPEFNTSEWANTDAFAVKYMVVADNGGVVGAVTDLVEDMLEVSLSDLLSDSGLGGILGLLGDLISQVLGGLAGLVGDVLSGDASERLAIVGDIPDALVDDGLIGVTTKDCEYYALLDTGGADTAMTELMVLVQAINDGDSCLTSTTSGSDILASCGLGGVLNEVANALSGIFSLLTAGDLVLDLVRGLLAGTSINEYHAASFFIKPSVNDPSVPALWRAATRYSASSGVYIAEEELVQGVENMQLRYGYDSDGDDVPNYYLAANDSATLGTSWDWGDVVSVKVSLLMRSIDPVESDPVANADFEGIAVATDRYLRQRVSFVVELKNRI